MKTIMVQLEKKTNAVAVPIDDFEADRFDEDYGEGQLEVLLTLFANTSLSFKTIGASFGRTREWARLRYMSWLAPLPQFPNTGRLRQRSYYEASARERIKKDPFPTIPKAVISRSREFGLEPEFLLYRDSMNLIKRTPHVIVLGGHVCRVRHLTNAFRPKPSERTLYSHTQITWWALNNYEFQIYYTRLTGKRGKFFVIPSQDVLDSDLIWQNYRIGKRRVKALNIYLPHFTMLQVHTRKIDWLQYLDAWHLLETPKG
jgi:hypothetical protein